MDLISRQAAIRAESEACFELRGVFGRCADAIRALPSVHPLDPCETCLHKGKGWDEEPCDGCTGTESKYEPDNGWIPVSERLPDDLSEVNVTFVNHDPEPYYNFVKDKPFTTTAVYYKEKWYWYTSTCVELLAEYGRNPNQEIDDDIEITAWMPLPEPYKGEKE